MKLCYTKNNMPYISFENGNKLIFSGTLEREKLGFKYLVFSGLTSSSVTISAAKAKKKSVKEVIQKVNFTTGTDFKGIPKIATKAGFSKTIRSFLSKTFKSLVDEKGYFPRENLETLEEIFKKANGSEEDTWNNDPTVIDDFEDEN